jgi:hypothetical protein
MRAATFLLAASGRGLGVTRPAPPFAAPALAAEEEGSLPAPAPRRLRGIRISSVSLPDGMDAGEGTEPAVEGEPAGKAGGC